MMPIVVMKTYSAKRKHKEVCYKLHQLELTESGSDEIPS